MKRLIIIFLTFSAVAIGCLGALFASPYYFYHKIVAENFQSRWYFLDKNRSDLTTPAARVELERPRLRNEDLWRKFHLRDIVIPLPVRNPLFYTAPILRYEEAKQSSRLGLSIYGGGYREISKLFFVSNMLMDPQIRAQELFKLPLAKNIIQSASAERVWEDIFGKDLSEWNIPFSEMIYNLYILHLRASLLPEGMKSFAALNPSTGIVELKSENKDYVTELVMTRSRGVVYSYIIVTEKNNADSQVLRYKFLNEIEFRPGSEALAGILYKEFKGLPYERQVDHEGMLYLLSAWSHQSDNQEYLKEMIFHLERGEGNERQLRPLYEYASARYGKLFSQRLVEGVELEGELKLKRAIELEEKRELERIRRMSSQKPPTPEPTMQERLQRRIEEAKRNKRSNNNRMILD